MNQKDPNNVSGLLKMHLRERHLLSDQAVATVVANMSSGMVRKACLLGSVGSNFGCWGN